MPRNTTTHPLSHTPLVVQVQRQKPQIASPLVQQAFLSTGLPINRPLYRQAELSGRLRRAPTLQQQRHPAWEDLPAGLGRHQSCSNYSDGDYSIKRGKVIQQAWEGTKVVATTTTATTIPGRE